MSDISRLRKLDEDKRELFRYEMGIALHMLQLLLKLGIISSLDDVCPVADFVWRANEWYKYEL